MLKGLRKTDIIFICSVVFILLIHITCIFSFPGTDESFYPSIALRLIDGDSLISDEWHLSQFSSLFSFLPVFLFVKIKGSTDGLIVFIRALYILIHTAAACGIYKVFRKHGISAVLAGTLFFYHIPYSIAAISYISVYAMASLFFSILLLKIYEKPQKKLFIAAGFCFGCCCVCNPLFCLVFPFYLIACVLWELKKRIHTDSNIESDKCNSFKDFLDVFFLLKSVTFFFCGLCIIAGVSVIFYFSTGGTLSGIYENVGMMLKYTEYNVSFSDRMNIVFTSFNDLNFNLPFLLPLLIVILFVDKKRKECNHRIIYLCFSFFIGILYACRMVFSGVLYGIDTSHQILAVLLPLTEFATVSYILTDNKNKKMFICMFIPGLFCALFQFFVSRTVFATLGWSLIPCAVAGVFFIIDLFKEISEDIKCDNRRKSKDSGRGILYNKIGLSVISLILCVQFLLGSALYIVFHYEEYFAEEAENPDICFITEGPAAGLILPESAYENHIKTLRDLNKIKEMRDSEDNVLLLTCEPWTYLYIESGFATYTAWYQSVKIDALVQYYIKNPDKTPDYIYIGKDYDLSLAEMRELHLSDCSKSYLENGVLFVVGN